MQCWWIWSSFLGYSRFRLLRWSFFAAKISAFFFISWLWRASNNCSITKYIYLFSRTISMSWLCWTLNMSFSFKVLFKFIHWTRTVNRPCLISASFCFYKCVDFLFSILNGRCPGLQFYMIPWNFSLLLIFDNIYVFSLKTLVMLGIWCLTGNPRWD